MLRPPSIVTFERCYLGAWAIGLVNLILTWHARVEQATIAAAQNATVAGAVGTVLIGGIVFGAVITFVLWYFVARRASVVAKWIVVAFFAIGLIGLLMNMARGIGTPGLGGVLTVVAWVLQVIAVWMLFRPDANLWFARRGVAPVEDTFR